MCADNEAIVPAWLQARSWCGLPALCALHVGLRAHLHKAFQLGSHLLYGCPLLPYWRISASENSAGLEKQQDREVGLTHQPVGASCQSP